MHVAITGASGHIGAAILPILQAEGYSISALVRADVRAFEGIHYQAVYGNLLDKPALEKLVHGADVVIHSAAIISLEGDPDGKVWEANVEGTRLLLETAVRAGVKRFIHLSSIHAYQQLPIDKPLDERGAYVGPDAIAYDQSKAAAEKLVLSYAQSGMEVVVLNPTCVLGPPDYKPSLIGQATIDLALGKIPAVFEGGFDFVDVRDVAQAIVNAITRGRNGEVYFLGGTWYSMADFATRLHAIEGQKKTPFVLPVWVAYACVPLVKWIARIQKKDPVFTRESIEALVTGNRHISWQKAAIELGYNPRPIEEAIKDSLSWFRTHQYLAKK